MKMLCSVQLSKHRYKTPEGYLVCKDCIIARTGKQTYLKAEIGRDDGSDEEYIDIDRKPNEVFNEKTLASFEGKPLTIEHPSESVSPENYKTLSVGNVHNVRRGKFEGQDVMYADINVYDAEAINLIESGEMVELSCGYDCDITEGPNPEQINIRGNHVALCEQGRAGIARIQDSWGAKPVAIQDAVGRGTLIQEFGRYGEQYKIVKIVGNVMYCEELVTKKNTLFKRDKENVDWAVIKKSDVRDSMVISTWDIILETTKPWHFVLNDVEKHIQDKYGYDMGTLKEKVEKGERALQCIPLQYGNVGETEIQKLSIGPFESEKDAKDFYIKDLKDFIDSHKNDKTEMITVLYTEQKRVVGDSEEKYRPNDFSSEFTKKELDDFVANLYANPETDSFPGNDPHRMKKIFLDPNKKEEFMKSLPKEAEVMADEFDHVWEDKNGDIERWLVYWEVYYYDVNGAIEKATEDINSAIFALQYVSDKETLEKIGKQVASDLNDGKISVDDYKRFYKIYKENEDRLNRKVKDPVKDSPNKLLSLKEWMKENYPAALEHWDELTDVEKSLIIKEHKLYILENDTDDVQDSFVPLYIISLPGDAWLDDNDRPTNDKEKARKFNSESEAEEYRKVFCNGKVVKLNDQNSIKDEFNIPTEKENIKKILDEKNVKYTKIGDSWGSITIDFDDRKELRKAGKALVKIYDIELFEDDDELYIAVYSKFPHKRDIELNDSAWTGYNLIKGRPAQDFKQYLRDRGMEFEPSENGDYIHFEVKNADEDVDKEIKAIIDHYTKVGLMDSYSKRFYTNAIKALKEKLEKLEKNELLDANQKDYEIQKANMKTTIESQIKQYEEKLNGLD